MLSRKVTSSSCLLSMSIRSLLGESSVVGPQVWSPDLQQKYPRGVWQKGKSSGPTSDLLNLKSWGYTPASRHESFYLVLAQTFPRFPGYAVAIFPKSWRYLCHQQCPCLGLFAEDVGVGTCLFMLPSPFFILHVTGHRDWIRRETLMQGQPIHWMVKTKLTGFPLFRIWTRDTETIAGTELVKVYKTKRDS